MSEINAADLKKAAEEVAKAFEEFKSTNDANLKKRDALYEEKLAAINSALDKFEPLSAKLAAAEAQARAAADSAKEVQNSLDRIETKLNRPGSIGHNGGPPLNEDPKHIAFLDYARFDNARMADDRKAMMQISDDTGGGYLAVPEYVKEIIKAEIEYSPFRQFVRTRTTSQRSVQLPRRTGTFAARWTGDTETRQETPGLAYGLHDCPVHELTAEVYISMADIEDSAFDIEAELKMEFAEQFGVAEGAAIAVGASLKKPEGLLTAPGTIAGVSGNATKVTADGLIKLKYSLKTAYARRATWAMNRTTLGTIRTLKDGDGRYIWAPGLTDGRPNTIDGDPYFEAPDMPVEAAGAKVVIYADFQRAYTLVDRLAMAMLRDGITKASEGMIKFLARKRVGGMVTLAEAIAILTCSE